MDGPWTDIDKATSAARKPVADDIDHYLRATVSYTDKFGSQTASVVSENAVEARTVANAAPDFSEHDTDDDTTGNQATRKVDENANGANVGKAVNAKDDDDDILLYTMVDGTTGDNNNNIDELTLFSIDERSGQIKTKKAIDSNAGDSPNDADGSEDTYTVVVTATDPSGATGEATVVITITNINDAPKFATFSEPSGSDQQLNNPTAVTVVENVTALDGQPGTAGAQSPNYEATDDDTADSTLKYAVTGADAKQVLHSGRRRQSGLLLGCRKWQCRYQGPMTVVPRPTRRTTRTRVPTPYPSRLRTMRRPPPRWTSRSP